MHSATCARHPPALANNPAAARPVADPPANCMDTDVHRKVARQQAVLQAANNGIIGWRHLPGLQASGLLPASPMEAGKQPPLMHGVFDRPRRRPTLTGTGIGGAGLVGVLRRHAVSVSSDYEAAAFAARTSALFASVSHETWSSKASPRSSTTSTGLQQGQGQHPPTAPALGVAFRRSAVAANGPDDMNGIGLLSAKGLFAAARVEAAADVADGLISTPQERAATPRLRSNLSNPCLHETDADRPTAGGAGPEGKPPAVLASPSLPLPPPPAAACALQAEDSMSYAVPQRERSDSAWSSVSSVRGAPPAATLAAAAEAAVLAAQHSVSALQASMATDGGSNGSSAGAFTLSPTAFSATANGQQQLAPGRASLDGAFFQRLSVAETLVPLADGSHAAVPIGGPAHVSSLSARWGFGDNKAANPLYQLVTRPGAESRRMHVR